MIRSMTGGARGLEKVFCLALADEGAKIVVADILADDAQQTAYEISTKGGSSMGIKLNVSSEAETLRMVEETIREFGRVDILVNTLAPGFTDTEASKTITDDMSKFDTSLTPLGRLEQPKDLVVEALFFSSNESDFITGQTLVVDGGHHMH